MSENTSSEYDDNKDSSPSEPVEVPAAEDVLNPAHVEDDDPEANVGEEVVDDA